MISRLLRRGDSPLLAAKVLVLCRLLHKSLSQRDDLPPLVEKIRKRIASLRGKLLQSISAQFSHSKTTSAKVLHGMCAYLLATSSTPRDVLKHFHHMRLEGMKQQLEKQDRSQSSVVNSMLLYFRTIQDTQLLLPTSLADMLVTIKSKPLIDDTELRELVELNLDIHKPWLPEEIQNFTPWLRHDVLQRSQTESMLQTWALTAFATFLEGLRRRVGSLGQFQSLVWLRKEILDQWFHNQATAAGYKSSNHLEDIRSVVNDRMRQLIWLRAHELHHVGDCYLKTVQNWVDPKSETGEGLWTLSTSLVDIDDWATGFTASFLNRLNRRDGTLLRVNKEYQTWLANVNEVSIVVDQLKEQKWGDELDEEDEEDEFESQKAQLSEDDPAIMEEQLALAITSAFQDLEKSVQAALGQFSAEHERQQTTFTLRLVRDIRYNLPRQGNTASFSLTVTTTLQEILAKRVSDDPLQSLRSQLGKRKDEVVFDLWEGSPPLPIQPSPTIFQFLYELVSSMARVGNDIWTQAATKRLKTYVEMQVSTALRDSDPVFFEQSDGSISGITAPGEEPLVGSDDSKSAARGSGDATTAQDKSIETRFHIQLLFDLTLLQRLFSGLAEDESVGGIVALEHTLSHKVGLPNASKEKLQRNVQDFWKRTALLFSLVASFES